MVNINVVSQGEDSGSSISTVHDTKQREGSIEEEEGWQLLPGILDDLTIDLIAPKLPWTTFYILCSVSRGWQQAIQSRQIYEARVRSQSTQTLVVLDYITCYPEYIVLNYPIEVKNFIALYSTEDGLCRHLPPIPGIRKRFPSVPKYVSLDGKLYIIGGLTFDSLQDSAAVYTGVYVFDLACQGQWKQLASMRHPRSNFGCCVMNGKIYVFGGTSGAQPLRDSEVYDPKENDWSPVPPMISFRACHEVIALGEELFVHGGKGFHPDFVERTQGIPFDRISHELMWRASSAEIYHTVKDEWRIVEHYTQTNEDLVVMMRGKLHKVTRRGIDVYDTQENSWEFLQSFSFNELERRYSFLVSELCAVAPVDNELMLVMGTQNINARYPEPRRGTCLIRSQGCGDKNKEIVWQKLECSLPLGNIWSSCLCPIQL